MAGATMYDFVIIGSGTSGGTLAWLLQRAGAKCLLIEAGKHFHRETFPTSEAEFSSQMFWGGGIEYDTRCAMGFLRGKCVGGGSVVNQALQDRFDKVALDDWRAQSGVSFFTPDAMDSYYTAAENGIVLQTLPPEQRNRSAQLFIRGLDHAEVAWAALRRGQCDCGVEQGNDCIACLGGCHRDSKQSTLIAYVQPAITQGLDLVPEFFVDRIEHNAQGVTVHGHNGAGAKTFSARKGILAAGSLGTTQLLLNSGFKSKLPALGKGFAMHPQFMSFAEFEEPVDAHKGAFQTVKSSDSGLRKRGYKLENVYAGPVSIAMLFRDTGPALQAFMKKYRYYACVEVAVRDEAVGELTTARSGKLQIKKQFTAQDTSRAQDGLELVRNVFDAVGAKSVFQSPLYFGLHLMGGCAIGTDPQTSVVNEAFQVHGCEQWHTADTSIFPNAPGINPALTVMALAYKLAEQLKKS